MNELSDKDKPRKLEDIFREGMEEAEATPSDRLWERIDHNLDTKAAIFYKKRLVWFQRIAAACIILVLFAGGYFFYAYRTTETPQLAVAEKSPGGHAAQTNRSTQIGKGKSDMGVDLPEINLDNVSATEKEIVATAPEEPVYTPNLSLNKKYQRHNNKAKIVTTPMLAAENINVATQLSNTANKIHESDLALNYEAKSKEINKAKDNTLPSETTGQIAVKSWAGLKNNSKTLDTIGSLAVKKPLTYATETAQEVPKKQTSRWTLSGKYASHYFNQNIALAQDRSPARTAIIGFNGAAPLANANTGNSNFSEAMQEYDKNTMSSYSYNTSLGAAYQLNSHWALETGLDYTQNVAITSSSYIFNNSQSNLRYSNLSSTADVNFKNMVSVPTTALVASLAGSVDFNNAGVVKTDAFDTQYRYRLIGIPIKMSYKTNSKKSFYYVSGGLLTNFLMQAHILSASPVVPDIKYAANAESPFQDWQVAATASVGKGFKVTKGFSLRAGLEASKYLTSLAAHPEYLEGKHGKPYTIGIALSSSYTLGH